MQAHLASHLTTLPDLAELNAECQHAPVVIDRPVIVYGKGELGAMAMDYLKAIGVLSTYQIDAAWLAEHERIPTPFLEALILVAIARWPYVPIERALTEQGFTNVAPFLDVTPNHPEHPLANGWFADPLDLDKVQAVLDMFEDDVSRKHYVQFLAWRRLREEWTFEGAPVDVEGPRYWPPEVASVLHDHEMLFDGGGGDGSVSQAFADTFDGDAVEFDPLGKEGFRWALSDRVGPGIFTLAGAASRLGESGVLVRVECLDGIDWLPAPTFIKFHLEGHELPALRGAAETIETHRPILAVTTYHQPDGMTDIPLWLRENCPDYRFLWRNSAWCGEGAVVFSVPKERNAA